jgi:hypothetical protein
MNKTVLVVLVFLSAVSLIAFARGAGERTGSAQSFGSEPAYSEEPITLTGTLDLRQPYGFPVLKTGSGRWGLIVRGMHRVDVPVKDGDTVTLIGFEAPPYYQEKGMRAFVVQKAVIAGREYRLSGRPGGHWTMGLFGMMGHRRDGLFGGCSRWEDLS